MALPVKSSLQRRIVLLVVVGMFLMLTSLGVSAWLAVTESTRRVLQERLALAQTTADHLSYTLNQNLARLEEITFAEGVDIEDDDPGPEERALHNAYLGSIFRDGVFIIDRDGNVLWTEPAKPGWLDSNIYSYPHVKGSLSTGRPTISNVFALEPSRRQMVSAIVPIKNRQGNIVGAVGGQIDPTGTSLRDLLQPVRLSSAYIDVVDANGVVVTSTRDERILQSSDHGNVLAGLINSRSSTVSTCHSCHEVAREQRRDAEVMAFAPLDSPSWGVAVRQSEPEALAPVNSLRQRFIFLSVILVAMGLPLTWAMGRSLVRPLEVLTAAARKIAKGNLDDPIPNLGKDEIGMLAKDLDAMRLELRDSLEQIRQWNRELEARVQQRTRQLQESRDYLQTLNTIANALSQSLDLEEVLGRGLKQVMDAFKAEAGWVQLVDKETGALVLAAQHGLSPRVLAETSHTLPGQGLTGTVAKLGVPVVAAELAQDARFVTKSAQQEGWHSFASAPLKSKDRVLGVVAVLGRQPGQFSEQDLQLLASIGSQMGVASDNAMLYKEIQQKEATRGELLHKVIAAQEEERKRIARELHDDTSQALAALVMTLDSAVVADGSEPARGRLLHMKELAVRTLDELHQIILDLRPSMLDDLGLVSAIRWYAESRLESQGIKVSFETSGDEQRLPSQMETALFRVVQEAITNIAKHAEADNVVISLEFNHSTISIEVEDDGRGFDIASLSRAADKSGGLGLMGMKERIGLLDGTLTLDSEPSRGTRLSIKVPLPEKDGAGAQDKSANS